MKRIIFILILTLSALNLFALPKDKPKPLAKTNFTYPELEIKNLSNGLKVYLMKNTEQPTLSVSLIIKSGRAYEKKTGSVEILSSLITKGAGKRNAAELAELLDGTGTRISVDDRKDYILIDASGTKKNQNTIFEVLSDIVMFPKLDKSEFEKIKKQKSSDIALEKNDGFTLMSKLSSQLLYGQGNQYAKFLNEKSLDELSLEDVATFYSEYFKLNNATLAVTGDFDESKILANLEKYFKNWNKGELPNRVVEPFKSEAAGVYFIKRPASVQSTIAVVSKVPQIDEQEYESTQMLANVMGSGFMGRLFKTLRETYSYCYSPFSFQSSNKLGNILFMGAEVRNEVTDSALTVLLQEVNSLKSESVSEKELEQIKQYNLGRFYLGFEESKYLMNKVLIGDVYGISYEYIKSFPERLKSTLPSDIMSAATTYFTPVNTFIVVVGDDSVREKLEKFGQVIEYDMDFKAEISAEKVDISPKELLNKYAEAIGGSANIEKVKSLKSSAVVDLDAGPSKINGTYEEIRADSKLYIKMDLSAIKTIMVYNGAKGFMINGEDIKEAESNEVKLYQYLAPIFKDLKLLDLGYKCEVVGKRNGMIILTAKVEGGNIYTYYFDEKTYLIKKIENLEVSTNLKIASTTIIDSYTKVNDVLLPKVMRTTNNFYKATFNYVYKINEPVSDELFKVKQ